MKNTYFLYSIVASVCFVGLFVPSFLENSHTNPLSVQNTSSKETPPVQKLIPAEIREVKNGIRFTGDIMLARNVENLMTTYGPSYPFTALPKHPPNLYLIGNFESAVPVLHVPTQTMHFSFSTKKENLTSLQEYGFTHLGIANNHSYDFGSIDFLHTKSTLAELGLHPFGDQQNQASSTIQFLEFEDETVAMVGIFAVDTKPTALELQRLFKRAQDGSSIQIAYVHFGTEYMPVHSVFQENLSKNLIDIGFDVVIGHHPHIVQDIELYKGRLIFYSLGNFIFDQYFSKEVQEGLMIEMQDSDEGIVFNLLPVTSIGSRSKPRFMEQYERDTFLVELAKKSDAELAVMIEKGKINVEK